MILYTKLAKGFGELAKLNGNSVWNRCYYHGRKVIPASIRGTKNHRQIQEDKEYAEMKQADAEFTKSLREEFNRSEATFEPNLEQFESVYSSAKKDSERLHRKFRQEKMYRKHFRQFVEKEISLLTYAEKEKIRYLHKSDPNGYSPESLASSFPVSPEGVEKIIKSAFRAISLKEIELHDQSVINRIKRIKSGEIEMTAKLEKRMQIRDTIPLSPGLLGPENTNLATINKIPKLLGEFGRLVSYSSNKLNAVPVPPDSGASTNMYPVISNHKEPSVGDYYTLEKPQKGQQDPLKSIPQDSAMTFKQFQSQLKLVADPEKEFSNNELDYLKNLEEVKVESVSIDEIKNQNGSSKSYQDDTTDYSPEMQDFLNYQTIPKYKPSVQKAIELKFENDDSYIYKPETGYQRPYVSGNSIDPESIFIPEEAKKQDAIYRKGNSYYDSDGSFLYRVV